MGCGQKCPANPELVCDSDSCMDGVHLQVFPKPRRWTNRYRWEEASPEKYQEWEDPFGDAGWRWVDKGRVRSRLTDLDIAAIRRLRVERFGV